MVEDLITINSTPTVLNLEDEAYQDAGSARGNANSLANKLEAIFSGNLLDEQAYSSQSPEQRRALETRINTLQQENLEQKLSIEELQEHFNANKEKSQEFRNSRDAFLSGGISKDNLTDRIEIFSPIRFSVTSFFLFMLSVFIFLFYVAVVYKALIMKGDEIAQQLLQGEWGINVLPSWQEASHAMVSNPMIIFAPFVFFGFGYAVHLLLGVKDKFKYLWVSLVLIVTFALDYFLAERIHNQMNGALEMMGLPLNDKFSDILIVLILGFVVYIIWSVIFHSWMTELEKRNIPDRLGSLIKLSEKENAQLQSRIRKLSKQIEINKGEIEQTRHILELKSIPKSAVIKSLTTYTHGWYKFITQLKDHDLRTRLLSDCESVLNELKDGKQLSGYKVNFEK